MRKLIPILLLLFIPIAFAAYQFDECQRTQDPVDVPCEVISKWKPALPSNCTDPRWQVDIRNESDILIQSLNWSNHSTRCSFIFNFSNMQTYIYNSSLDSGVVVVEGSRVWLLAILMMPLGMAFLFLYWASTLPEEQEPFKWFMRLLSLVMLFVMFTGADIIINKFSEFSGLLPLFNIEIVKWIFLSVFLLFLTFFLYRIAIAMRMKRDKEFEEGFLR